MKVSDGRLAGLKIIEPKVFGDARGYFMESYNEQLYRDTGIETHFVQDNRSLSSKGVIRGLHYQIGQSQAKLVSVLKGEVLDVVVDLRQSSPTFGQVESFILSAKNKKQIFIPEGFAHGFSVLSEEAEFFYKVNSYYSPKDERGIAYDDPSLNIDWKVTSPLVSDKDKVLPLLKDQKDLFT